MRGGAAGAVGVCAWSVGKAEGREEEGKGQRETAGSHACGTPEWGEEMGVRAGEIFRRAGEGKIGTAEVYRGRQVGGLALARERPVCEWVLAVPC